MHPVLLERRFPHFDLISLSSYIILVEIRFLEHFLHHLVSQREFSLGFYKHQVLSLRCSDFSLIIFVWEEERLLLAAHLLRRGRLQVPPLPDIAHKVIICVLQHHIFKAARWLLRRNQIWIVELLEHLLARVESRALGVYVLLNVDDLLRLILRLPPLIMSLFLNACIVVWIKTLTTRYLNHNVGRSVLIFADFDDVQHLLPRIGKLILHGIGSQKIAELYCLLWLRNIHVLSASSFLKVLLAFLPWEWAHVRVPHTPRILTVCINYYIWSVTHVCLVNDGVGVQILCHIWCRHAIGDLNMILGIITILNIEPLIQVRCLIATLMLQRRDLSNIGNSRQLLLFFILFIFFLYAFIYVLEFYRYLTASFVIRLLRLLNRIIILLIYNCSGDQDALVDLLILFIGFENLWFLRKLLNWLLCDWRSFDLFWRSSVEGDDGLVLAHWLYILANGFDILRYWWCILVLNHHFTSFRWHFLDYGEVGEVCRRGRSINVDLVLRILQLLVLFILCGNPLITASFTAYCCTHRFQILNLLRFPVELRHVLLNEWIDDFARIRRVGSLLEFLSLGIAFVLGHLLVPLLGRVRLLELVRGGSTLRSRSDTSIHQLWFLLLARLRLVLLYRAVGITLGTFAIFKWRRYFANRFAFTFRCILVIIITDLGSLFIACSKNGNLFLESFRLTLVVLLPNIFQF